MSLASLLQAGGWPMYPLVLLAALALPVSLALPAIGYGVGKRRLAMVFTMLLAALGFAAIALGLFGRWWSLEQVRQALAFVDPSDREALALAGSSEARSCAVVGLAVAALPLAASGLMLGRAVSERRSAVGVIGGLLLGVGMGLLAAAIAVQQLHVLRAEEAGARALEMDRAMLVAMFRQSAARALSLGGLLAGPATIAGLALLGRAGFEDWRKSP